MGSLVRVAFAWSLLAGGLVARPAEAQPAPSRAQTQDGLSLTLPSGYRPAPELLQPTGNFESAFTEETPESSASPIQLFVARAPELATQEVFGLDDARMPKDAFVGTIRNTLGLQAADVTSSGFDAERAALWVTFRQSSGSQAQAMIELGPDDPAWQGVASGRLSATALACVLGVVLGGTPAVEASVVQARAQTAAAQCRQPREVVQAYLDELGPAFFAPFETSFAVTGYLTRTALVLTVVASDGSRAHDVEALARELRSTASVAQEALPDGAGPDRQEVARAKSLGRIGGVIIGSALGVLAFGLLFGFGLRKLGLSASRAAGSALAAVLGMGLLGWLFSGALTWVAIVQLVTYVVVSALAYRPLKRWLEGRSGGGGNRLLTDVRGLTTIEYSVLFVVVVVAGVAVWKQLGQSLTTTVSRETAKYSAELESAALSSGSGASSNPDSAWPGRGGALSPSGGGTPTRPSAPAEPPSLWERVGAATFDHPAVQQFARDHPIATALGKEASVMAAEAFIPGVVVFNAARTLRDEKASRYEKGVAIATIATAAIPPIAVVVKGASKLVKGMRAAKELRRAAQATEKTLELAAETADTARHVGAEIGALRRTAKVEKAAEEAGEAALRSSAAPGARLSPRAARRQAMREAGIPTSQQPAAQRSVTAPGRVKAGRQYDYDIPAPGGGTRRASVQHSLTDSVEGHGPHWEAGPVKPAGQVDSLGRPRLTSSKSKVDE